MFEATHEFAAIRKHDIEFANSVYLPLSEGPTLEYKAVPTFHVALADDDDLFCDAAQTVLEEEGFRVTRLANGIAALEFAMYEDADLLILDQRMPGMEGLNVFDALRLAGLSQPVIITSGKHDIGQLAKQHGAQLFLPKPFEAEEMLHMITCALKDQTPRALDNQVSGSDVHRVAGRDLL